MASDSDSKKKRPRDNDDEAASAASTSAWASACLAVSGSVAAVKAPQLAAALLHAGVSVDVVVTEAAYSLMQAAYRGEQPWQQLEALAESAAPPCSSDAAAATQRPALRVFRDADEWRGYMDVGRDPVLHVELAKRNRLLLVAPLCANTLAAAALGLCGNLVGSVLRAWYYDLDADFAAPLVERYGAHSVARPVLVAPAMNTFMWHQRVTATHLGTLEARGVRVVPPVSKRLACGDVGVGAMADVADVVQAALELLRADAASEAAARAAGKPPFVP